MKFFKKIIINNKKTLSFLGLKFYQSIHNKDTFKRTILAGIFTIKGDNLKIKYYFLGICFAETEIDAYKQHFYFRTPNLFRMLNINKALKLFYNQVPQDCDSIYYFSVPSGESYILANLLPIILKKNNSKNPFFLFRNQQVAEIFRLFNPLSDFNYKIFVLPYDFKFRNICKYSYTYKNKDIYIYFPTWHYYNQDCKILSDKCNDTHFYGYICDLFGIDRFKDINDNDAILSATVENTLYEKIKDINLNLDNFVIFAPEARTAFTIPEEFYYNLQQKLTEKGVDVFWNVKYFLNNKPEMKNIFLTYEEIYYLASKSKGIIGVRSGLFDVLSKLNNIPKFVLYTDFPLKQKKGGQFYTAEKAIVGFSLKKMPWTIEDNIYEYDTNKIGNDEIIENIIKNIERLKNENINVRKK